MTTTEAEAEARRRLRWLLPARLHPWIAALEPAEAVAEADRLALLIEEDNRRIQRRARLRRKARREAEEAAP